MAATNCPPSTGQPQGNNARGIAELSTTDEVKEYRNEGDGETTEHLNSMDLHDIKSELKKDAEEAETPKNGIADSTSRYSSPSTLVTPVNNQTIQIRPTVIQPMVYAANSFMVPPFTNGSSIYPVATPNVQQVKFDMGSSSSTTSWSKFGQSIHLPHGFQTSFVSGLPADQNFRSTFPFLMPRQYLTQMPYMQQQLSSPFGNPVAHNSAIHPHSEMISQQPKERKPHIKKPLNAFMLFMKEKRAEVMKESTLKESAAINQILGKKWHKLDKSEQAKYYEMAREERTKHMQMYPGWSARDNYAIHKKRKKKKSKQQNESENGYDECSNCTLDDQRNCRTKFGLKQQELWCIACSRQKITSDSDVHAELSSSADVEMP